MDVIQVAIEVLNEQGFPAAESREDFGTVTTDWHEEEVDGVSYSFKFRIKPSKGRPRASVVCRQADTTATRSIWRSCDDGPGLSLFKKRSAKIQESAALRLGIGPSASPNPSGGDRTPVGSDNHE
jgi:hypothetical protein